MNNIALAEVNIASYKFGLCKDISDVHACFSIWTVVDSIFYV